MISEFKIGNFKAFGPAQTIPLRPITLVFGPNSAGKSSIIQSLLLARHIHDTGNADAHQTTLGGSAVDLGGFAKYVHGRRIECDAQFCLTLERSAMRETFHYLNKLQTLTLSYTLGRTVGVGPGIVGIKAVQILLNGHDFIRLSMREDGILGVDADDLENQSLLAFGAYDAESVETCLELAQAPPARVEQITAKAMDAGMASADIRDAVTGKLKPRSVAELRIRRIVAEDKELGDSVAAGWRIVSKHVSETVSLLKFRMKGIQLDNDAPLPRENWDFDVSCGNADLDRPNYDPVGFYRRWLKSSDDEETSNDEAWSYALRYDIECLIEAANTAIASALSGTSYLGPLRWIPPRLIPEGEQFDASWAAGGGAAWQRLRSEPELLGRVNRFLQEKLHSQYRLRRQSLAPELDAETIALCVKRALASSAAAPTDDPHTSRVAEDAPPYGYAKAEKPDLATALQAELRAQTTGEGLMELSLVDAESGLAVSHRDVGTGISQLLPVLVNAAGGEKQLIAIEQPELHLHPALQAELGDVFIESALGENKNTFLIETHSEHLILRLLRRIRETAEDDLPPGVTPLHPEDVAVLYVKPGSEGSEVIELPVNIEGDFDKPWPDGFFPERSKELF